ncbi:MAG: tetratricopeptide repeat protein [Bacteroidetes bacterium]|nr:tetratricopeptide repeat protein [Bacteroidota bacterium]
MKTYPIYLLILILAFVACKGTKTAARKKNHVIEHPLNEADQSAFDAAFYEGNKQMVLSNHTEAIKQFKKCVILNQKNDATLYLLAKEYNASRQYNLSLPYAQQSVKINDQNIWYQLLVADNLKHTDQNLEAAKTLENIADKFKANESYYFDAAESYIVSKKFNDALHCLDKLEKTAGVNEDISFKKVDLFLRLSKKDQAINELQKLMVAFPTRTRYQVALAEIYFGFKEEIKAMEMLKQVLANQPNMPEAHLLLANIYRTNGENEKSFLELKLVFANPDADIKQKLEILSSFLPLLEHNSSLRAHTLELAGLLVIAHPSDDAGNMLYADILYHVERYQEAKVYYLKALNTNKTNFNLSRNLIQCEEQLNQYEEALKHATEALEAFPSQAIFYYYKAHAEFLLKDFAAALSTSKTGFEMGSENTSLLIQLLSILADAGNELKNYVVSDDAFDKILALDPNNLETLNNYSYYLSLRRVKLDMAEKMSKKTLDIDPNNASYLDTYGWILYQQEKYADAKIFIEKALALDPANNVLFEHIGDVSFQLNETELAMTYWKKAKENGNISPGLQKKINSKKLTD